MLKPIIISTQTCHVDYESHIIYKASSFECEYYDENLRYVFFNDNGKFKNYDDIKEFFKLKYVSDKTKKFKGGIQLIFTNNIDDKLLCDKLNSSEIKKYVNMQKKLTQKEKTKSGISKTYGVYSDQLIDIISKFKLLYECQLKSQFEPQQELNPQFESQFELKQELKPQQFIQIEPSTSETPIEYSEQSQIHNLNRFFKNIQEIQIITINQHFTFKHINYKILTFIIDGIKNKIFDEIKNIIIKCENFVYSATIQNYNDIDKIINYINNY